MVNRIQGLPVQVVVQQPIIAEAALLDQIKLQMVQIRVALAMAVMEMEIIIQNRNND